MRPGKLNVGALVVVLVLLFSGCDLLLQQGGHGALELTIDGRAHVSRSLSPDISVEIDHFRIAGVSDAGKTFQRNTKESQIVIRGLDAGYWNVTVDAYSKDSVHLYTASQRMLVEGGVALPLIMTLQPVSGAGTFSLGISWPEGSIETPVINGQLIPITGSPLQLDFAMDGNSADTGEVAVDGGYYTLIVKVMDEVEGEEILVAGSVELVRIVADHTTDAELTFSNINKPGSLLVEIEVMPDFQASLDVMIAGGETTKEYGTSATLTGSVAGDPGNTVLTWYVNGVAVEMGVDQLTIGGLIPGYYRVDLIAITADGRYGGTTTSWVQIAQPAL